MEENVALDSTIDKKFQKSLRGIHKLLKSGAIKAPKDAAPPKDKKRRKPSRGLVYMGHIPHGFYEEQMKGYFKQFGKVTNVKVARSKKNGHSKGYGFVEFAEAEVAKIVAETMNNYLMGKRLLKAEYIPPEKNKVISWRQQWTPETAPGVLNRTKAKGQFNKAGDNDNGLRQARNLLRGLNKTKSTLKNLGIDYAFFTPHDVPKEITDDLKNHENPPTKKEKAAKIRDVHKKKKAAKAEEAKKVVDISTKRIIDKKKAKKSQSPEVKKIKKSILSKKAEPKLVGVKKEKKEKKGAGMQNGKLKETLKKIGSKQLISLGNVKLLQSNDIAKKKKSK